MKKLMLLGMTLLLSTVIITGVFAAGTAARGAATGPLRAMFVGSAPNDEANVLAAINRRLEADLGVQLQTNYTDDYWNRLALAIAAGEEFDLVWAHTSTLSDLVSRGVYQPIDAAVRQAAPNLLTAMPRSALLAGTINNELYAISRVVPMAQFNLVYNIRGDLRVKYGLPPITTLEGLENYFNIVLANEPGMVATADHNPQPLYPVFANYYFPLGDGGRNPVYVDPSDPTHTVRSFMDSPGFINVVNTKVRWRQMGYILEDDSRVPNAHLGFINGIVACVPSNTSSENERIDALAANVPGAFIETVLLNPNPLYLTQGGDNMLAVASTSRRPNETVALINWIKSSQANFDLFSYGVEGVNYRVEGNSISYDGIADNRRYTPNIWMWNDISLMRFSRHVPAENITRLRDWDRNAVVTPVVGFNLNQDPVRTEVAQVNAIIGEYFPQLRDGSVPYAQIREPMMQALERAGLQRIIAETQRQLNAYIASNR